jgi:predicted nuclease of predicted toxin-antitoxin system
MTYAKTNDYVILTHDLDFGAILAATGVGGPSVLQIRADDLSPRIIGKQIVGALRQAVDAIQAGALVTVDPTRARITMLPIGQHDKGK